MKKNLNKNSLKFDNQVYTGINVAVLFKKSGAGTSNSRIIKPLLNDEKFQALWDSKIKATILIYKICKLLMVEVKELWRNMAVIDIYIISKILKFYWN